MKHHGGNARLYGAIEWHSGRLRNARECGTDETERTSLLFGIKDTWPHTFRKFRTKSGSCDNLERVIIGSTTFLATDLG